MGLVLTPHDLWVGNCVELVLQCINVNRRAWEHVVLVVNVLAQPSDEVCHHVSCLYQGVQAARAHHA